MGELSLMAEEVLKIHAKCTQGLEVGKSRDGSLCVIPIVGGSFEGKISGRVVSGGADWNTRKSKGAHVFAKYLLQADDGEYIAIENAGLISDDAEDVKIKTVPSFSAREDGPYSWLNYGVYVGSLGSGTEEGMVEITIYKMK
ncbi:MAG: DUF3237 domain-containing protein [Lachnospiraceae bacterium]|nr:DUF3237 domain-containing protein [Lachnospiraceae bacterium]